MDGFDSSRASVVIDQRLQAALGHESARQKVKPNGLTVVGERFKEFMIASLAICDSAAATTLSATKPNFGSKS